MNRIFVGAPAFALLILPSLSQAAQAAPRDDVLAGVSRCGSIGEDRTWLDCVYGAAQPMRARLGLPPAPASQQSLVPVAGMATPAMNSPPRYDVLYGISRCGGIGDDRTWLDCVYGAAQPMRAKLGLPPAPLSQQNLVPPAMPGMGMPAVSAPSTAQAMNAPPPVERPGFFARLVTPHHDTAEPPTHLRSYKFDANGMFVVTLANGEKWSQDIGDTARATWRKPAATYAVQIIPTPYTYYYLKIGPEVYMVNKG